MKLPDTIWELTSSFTEGIVFCASIIYALFFIIVLGNTLTYPLGLGSVEWHLVDNIKRVLEGLPLYLEPSLEYVPDPYVPLYYYVSALFSLIFGVDFFAPRLVSLLTAIACGAVIYSWLRKENVSSVFAFSGAGLFFSTHILYGFWYHMVRVDALFCFFLITGAYFLCCFQTNRTAVYAGFLFALAFLTKQTAIIAILPVLFACFFTGPKFRWFLVASAFALPCLLGMLLFNYFSDGWFWYFIFEVSKDHAWETRQWLEFWVTMLSDAWPVFLLSLLAISVVLFKEGWKKAALYFSLFTGFITCAYLMRVHVGGWVNAFMPAYLALSFLGPLAFSKSFFLSIDVKRMHALHAVFSLLLIAQFTMVAYDPRQYMPTTEDRKLAKKYLEYLGEIDGDILIDGLGFVSTREGRKTYAMHSSLWDIQRSSDDDMKKQINREFRSAIEQQKFAAVITFFPNPDKRAYAGMPNYRVSEHYRLKERIGRESTPSKSYFMRYVPPTYVFIRRSQTQ